MVARTRTFGRERGSAGQAAVELALVLPLVALVFLALIQVALVARDQLLLVHAAREAVREAAVADRPAKVAKPAAQARSGLKGDRLRVSIRGDSSGSATIWVQLRYQSPTEVVIVGALLPDVWLQASASMRRERSFA